MESVGKGVEDGVFDVFRESGFVELLEAGDFGGVGELLDMGGDEGVEQKVRVADGGAVGVDGFILRCTSAYPLPSSSSPTSSSFRMLCFGGDEGFPRDRSDGFPHKSSASGNDSCSSTSSCSSYSSLSKFKKETTERRGWSDAADGGRTSTATTTEATAATKIPAAATKKPRKEQPPEQQRPRTLKVRKENLGDRITALQQLVSPFGKSDTASVLHEALGYIRFLHNQVQVLSSPYLQRLPSSAHVHADGGGGAVVPPRRDLRSRGLCLVPVACTANVAGSNGADFWSPAMESVEVDCHQLKVAEH